MSLNRWLVSLLGAACLGLAACGDDADQPRTEASAEEERPQIAMPETAGDDAAPSIRIYMTDMEEFGEVAGVTASSDEFVELTLRLEDAEGEALVEELLEISSLVGNELSISEATTDEDGYVKLRLTPALPGEDVLTFTGGGISKQLSIYITDDAYGHPMEHMEARAVDLPEVEGAVSWDVMTGIDTREGQHGLLEPVFNDTVRRLDGQDVKIQGFMLPLDSSERQKHFILTRTPPSCFYCLPGGPESVVEIEADRPLEFTFEPVVLSGRMELLENSDMGLFYRLKNARLERQ
ncbi:MAG: DUF3299 domain-containing protein [Ectothiorhodospiraceae bacterium]|nr:DUF3299 domain-containing protein [Ectothiorhodospiraceae bacterium]